VAGRPDQIQIMYGLTGEHRLSEWEASWLEGFENSKPVRIGNAAYRQLQLDVYGEVMDALHHGRKGKLVADDAGWELQQKLLEHLETIWQEADHGIWEVRGGKRQFTNSKVMAWVAFDRAVKSVEQFRMDGPVDRWRAARSAIHNEVCRYGFDAKIGAFVQSYGSTQIDASALLIPLVGFLDPTDRRVRSTVEVVKKDLVVDGLVRRYHTDTAIDGLPPGEGVFLPCSFWLADNLILLGRRDEAKQLFERLLSLRTDLGLLSEEYDIHSNRLFGNFPQALSHIALINTAYLLTSRSKYKRHENEKFHSMSALP
jgi:GH15 family glucan-1,4-alpha-glucosidase